MARSKKQAKRKNGGTSSTTPRKKSQTRKAATTQPLPPSSTFSDLPLDVTMRITSFLLDSTYSNIPSHSKSIMMMASLACSCKMLRSAVELHLQPYAKSITSQRWDRLPRPFVKLVCADALRMKIDGVTKKAAMALMVPESVLGRLRYSEKRFSRRCTAHVYSVRTLLSYLSSVYPTVEAYEIALETKHQASNNARLKRAENKRIRAVRQEEIQAIMKEFHVGEAYKRDENLANLVKKYVANGSKKNLTKIKEDAREAGLHSARKAEVDALMFASGVEARTVKHADKEEYANTGDESILESIKTTIQKEKDRLGRLDDNRKAFHQTLLELTGGEEWILQVPDYVWTRNAMIHEFLDHGTGDVMEACLEIVSVLRPKQKDVDSENVSASVHKSVTELRREDLVVELQEHGLELRNDSSFCKAFMQGTTEACVQEVVATMKLSSHLFRWGHRCWSNNASALESVMRKRYYSGECNDWYSAFESVKSMVDHSYDGDDSDNDYYSDDDYYSGNYYRNRRSRW